MTTRKPVAILSMRGAAALLAGFPARACRARWQGKVGIPPTYGAVGFIALPVVLAATLPLGRHALAQAPAEEAPTGLAVTLTNGAVTLNWTAPTQDATSVTGYQVLRRRPDAGGVHSRRWWPTPCPRPRPTRTPPPTKAGCATSTGAGAAGHVLGIRGDAGARISRNNHPLLEDSVMSYSSVDPRNCAPRPLAVRAVGDTHGN